MGHVITNQGLKADPREVNAIVVMPRPRPRDKEGIRRFLGLVQYLAKFIPNLSDIDAPIRTLMKSEEESFIKLKTACNNPPVLALYNVNKPVEIECDASKDGLGAVLLQEGRAIAYGSRALTETEQRYAQIEKEVLARVYSCQKFHNYIFVKEVTVFSDHKPLETLFKKPLLSAPMRIKKMMIRMQWYDINVQYRKGTKMHISDALSRAYIAEISEEESEKIQMLNMISITTERYSEMQSATSKEMETLINTILARWPDSKNESPIEARPYFSSRDQLAVLDSVIYKGTRIVIPPSMRKGMLQLVHKSHLGIVKSKSRAREGMYWPAMNSDIEDLISSCSTCAEFTKKQTAEPLQPTPTPDLPYSHVGTDIFEFDSKKYLILIDNYSKYIDAVELKSESTSSVISAMKGVFAFHRLPSILRSDNGPQYNSTQFNFCYENGIKHERSSPHFQSSNGEAEKVVQIVKHLWRKCEDREFALLEYRTTPPENINLSPAQILMGRKPRNSLQSSEEVLKPTTFDTRNVKQHLNAQKDKQKFYFDQRKLAKELTPLEKGSLLRMETPGCKSHSPGTVVEKSHQPGSYILLKAEEDYIEGIVGTYINHRNPLKTYLKQVWKTKMTYPYPHLSNRHHRLRKRVSLSVILQTVRPFVSHLKQNLRDQAVKYKHLTA